jgi:hypothetical protein
MFINEQFFKNIDILKIIYKKMKDNLYFVLYFIIGIIMIFIYFIIYLYVSFILFFKKIALKINKYLRL